MARCVASPFLRLLLAATLLLPLPVGAGPLQIDWPWSRATPPGATVAVGYLRISNEGGRDDRLVGARSPIAERVTIHRSVESGGTTRMLHQDQGIPVPAGGSVDLEPGGYHLMLMWPERQLHEGDRVPVTLVFEHAGALEIELHVRPITAGIE